VQPTIIVHGGAWNIPDHLLEPHRAGCRAAALRGWRALQDGGSALDAIEAAIAVLEDDHTFDAGTGSFLNADGQVELDAGIMDGRTLAAGAVAAVHRVKNPISLARHVMLSDDVLLVGPGATRYAEHVGMPLCAEEDLVIERERVLWQQMRDQKHDRSRFLFGDQATVSRRLTDTVGAVAIDAAGNIAAGTSTGGSPFKWPGRVGDVPIVGSGFFADNGGGGASSTGWGEGIMRIAMAKHAVDLMAAGRPAPEAAEAAVRLLASKTQGLGGIILIDREGRVGHHYTTEHMAYAYVTADLTEPVVGV
jgi:beta-aspartyl-peptidase (threonine type)